MKIDFSTITVYELIALILSFTAIVIPVIKWAWNRWFVKPILNHLPTGKIYPSFDIMGSYLKIESVYGALNKPIVVKNIALRMIRNRDEKVLNQNWSAFYSPLTQTYNGGLAYSSEWAHPFRIEKDSLVTVFTVFEDFSHSLQRSLAKYDVEEKKFAKDCVKQSLGYNEALDMFKQQSFFKDVKDVLMQYFFWEIGKYDIELIVKYENEQRTFSYRFEINETEYEKLVHNMNEILFAPIKQEFNQPMDFQSVTLKLED